MIELPFARDEYQQRLRKIRTEMAKRGLELLVVNDVANQHYITGYDGWSFYTPQVVLVPIEEVEPVWIGRAMDAAGGLLTAWMKPENVVGFPEDHVQRVDRHPMDWIANWIVSKGWGSSISASNSKPTISLRKGMPGLSRDCPMRNGTMPTCW